MLIIAPFACLAMLSVPFVKEGTVADFALDTLGWMCFAGGALFRWWATLYLGGRKSRELAVEGPYSTCRNPLYFGTFLLTLSIAFYIHSLTFAVGIVVATPIYLEVTVPWEERVLRKSFGERFDRYKRETTKFIPDFRQLRVSPTVNVNVSGLKLEFQRALRWMWIPLVAQSLIQLKMAAWWPSTFRFP